MALFMQHVFISQRDLRSKLKKKNSLKQTNVRKMGNITGKASSLFFILQIIFLFIVFFLISTSGGASVKGGVILLIKQRSEECQASTRLN